MVIKSLLALRSPSPTACAPALRLHIKKTMTARGFQLGRNLRHVLLFIRVRFYFIFLGLFT